MLRQLEAGVGSSSPVKTIRLISSIIRTLLTYVRLQEGSLTRTYSTRFYFLVVKEKVGRTYVRCSSRYYPMYKYANPKVLCHYGTYSIRGASYRRARTEEEAASCAD